MPARFNVPFGQDLCDMLHAELSLVCSFMDASGRIVASSERARIGQPHPVALRIMRGEIDEYCVSAEEAARSDTVREGIDMAIDFDGARLACFAVAGPVALVLPLARIVRFYVTALVQSRLTPEGEGSQTALSTHADKALRDAYEMRTRQLSDFANLSSDWFWEQDEEFRFTRFFGHSVEQLGKSPSAYIGKRRWERPLHGVSAEQLAAHKACLERHEPFHHFEYETVSAEGKTEYISINGAPRFDAQGRFVGYHGTGSNITERVTNQLLLQERSAALQQANAEMEKKVQERTAELSRQLGFVNQLIEAIPAPLFYKDAQARYLGGNSAFEAFIGTRMEQLLGKSPLDVAPPALAQNYMAADQSLLDHPGRQIYESQVKHADGQLRDVVFHKATFTLPDGSVGGLVGVMLDITERKRMENELRQAATFFDNSAEGMTVARKDGTIVATNRAFSAITGYARDEVVGQTPRMLQSGRHGPAFYADMWQTLVQHGRWQGEVWNKRKSGEIYPQWLSIMAVRNAQGETTHYVATFSDITQQKQHEERIQQLAFSAPLTGLPNRRLLLDRLEHALAVSNHNQHSGALFFIDIDDFKGLNDTRGHYVGDLLLQQIAARLSACTSEGDTVARLGGDEFVVMLENLPTDPLHAMAQAEAAGSRILLELSQPYTLHGSEHHHSASIGVALFGQSAISVEDVLKQADMAMYRAKAAGRNAMCFFDPQMQSVLAERVALEKNLRHALQHDEFLLHYQPQVNQAGALIGVEALVRWQPQDAPMVSPAQFIPLAEETGLILPLGRWVLRAACEQLASWAQHPQRSQWSMAVNVSARQFHHPEFVAQVLAALEQTGANPQRLKLELTESLLIDRIDDVVVTMESLKARGVCFSLDDFGTGYSSLAYLKRLPLDQLKIDQGFVRDVLTDDNDAAIARMVVALADSLGLQVIAEGVESAEQRDFLAQIGCLSYQGYFFSRPLPVQALHAWADAQRSADSYAVGEGI